MGTPHPRSMGAPSDVCFHPHVTTQSTAILPAYRLQFPFSYLVYRPILNKGTMCFSERSDSPKLHGVKILKTIFYTFIKWSGQKLKEVMFRREVGKIGSANRSQSKLQIEHYATDTT
jgi:hypothetical protein